MKFKSYPKIHRLGKEEVEDYLLEPVIVQEKIDGANVSIWLDDGVVRCGTRTRELPLDESFNGFQEAVNANPLIKEWLEDDTHQGLRLYAEWLVKHTITYPDTAYRKIYLYDIYNDEAELYFAQAAVREAAEAMGLEYPQLFVAEPRLVMVSELTEMVGKTMVEGAANGEGVVIKNPSFVNQFGDQAYAKQVHEHFKEANAIVFGGNNKHSESYWEMYVVNKYCTLGRVQKIMTKLQAETETKLDMKETPQIAGRCVHDMIVEEGWEIFNKIPKLDNKRLKNLATKKFIQIYHDLLNNSVSIADSSKT